MFQHITTIKKRGNAAFFAFARYELGLPPQTPTQETFREKFLGTSKAFEKINWYSRCESFCGFLRGFFQKAP